MTNKGFCFFFKTEIQLSGHEQVLIWKAYFPLKSNEEWAGVIKTRSLELSIRLRVE